MALTAIVLAAGQGKRMYSDLPKVLHQVGGQAMLAHVLQTVQALKAEQSIVVYGHGGEQVRVAFQDWPGLNWVEQAERLGTGHAVAQTLPLLTDNSIALVLYGDVPMIQPVTLEPLISSAERGALGLLTAVLHDPSGYGRIVRDEANRVSRIVEHRDASPEQLAIREINTGIIAVAVDKLRNWVGKLSNNNAQGEYYLTDIIEFAVRDGISIEAHRAADVMEIQGINDRQQLADIERYHQRRLAETLMRQGVTLRDPNRLDIRGHLYAGRDVSIDINTVFEGEVTLGDGVYIEPNCILRNCNIGPGCVIHANSVLEGVEVAEQAEIGPFARLRPGTRLAAKAKIGNFVETKNALFGQGSKANHLSYIGDTEVGRAVNIGAGTITCNYDGANKHKTVIEDEVFIGSNTALVAPITIGRGATVGAGSTLNKNVPSQALVVTRSPARNLLNWQRPKKNEN